MTTHQPLIAPPRLLVCHLSKWLGAWPPCGRLQIVGSEARERPGWDGNVHALVGVGNPQGTVLSVPSAAVEAVRTLGDDLGSAAFGAGLAAALRRPGAVFGRGVLRWADAVADPGEPGVWLPASDPRVPEWLRPFNGDVLVLLDADGRYAAGVGRKLHDEFGHELAVGTEPGMRGRGLAQRLVAQAARRVLADGAVPTYLHDPSNAASARVAEAAGFADRGWSVYGLWDPPA